MTDTLDLDALASAAADEAPAAAPVADAAPEAEKVVDHERGAKISIARRAKLDAIFAGKKYVILKEIDLTDDPAGRKFTTPLGNSGKKGFAIRLAEGYTPSEGYGETMFFGASVLREAAETYGAVEMEAKPTRTRRSKEEKEADELAKNALRREAMEALAAELGL